MCDDAPTKWGVLWRGIKGVCPNCGRGRLFSRFITQHEMCSECGEDFSDIRADDAPPWLTIFITGHLVVPLIVEFARHDVFAQSIETAIVIGVALVSVYLILPRAKGLFIAAIWWQSKR
ncbi:MAG: DUF983 domain-containing protein [Alphaproteobacteria bacterium]|nr:DUF983 domain-containing protein [Alphaproteobacteria bacterium]